MLRHPARRGANVSMSAVICYRPDGSEARLAFALREGAYDTRSLAHQLDLLATVLGGEPAVMVWDNLNVHKSHDMGAFVAAQPWLEVAYLPPYAPELNPVEGLWANLKAVELANHACRTTASWSRPPRSARSGSAVTSSCCSVSCTTAGWPCS